MLEAFNIYIWIIKNSKYIVLNSSTMKKSIPFIIALVITSALLPSCVTFTGSFSAGPYVQGAKFEGKAKGEAKAQYLFGLGGWFSDGLVEDARVNLIANTPLKEGQFLSNYAVDVRTGYYWIYIKRSVTVTADIVRDVTVNEKLYSPSYFTINDTVAAAKVSYLHLNDTIYLNSKSYPKAIIEQILEKGAFVRVVNDTKKQFVDFNKIFISKDVIPQLTANSIKMGDVFIIPFRNYSANKNVDVHAVLLAANDKYALIKVPSWLNANGIEEISIKELVFYSKK